ncbi:growth inhibitor PemK [Caulobacter sp. Root1455]|jgi:mRNA interferase MazF|uniref:type II toxin-antitoxin system PemK/MazF family toxin n=1 Tax=unclassified Caulobacter TaxID=2648921 RepID=UPI0006FDD4DD|nr:MULTISPECIES: type II toxin-antitoxin system PemK/MazF family toxin [unclassified Caulobacter]KQY29477.1 growth inhibitor PemK [Caulobacter sp. Root487D2Y]KQY95944.1 growth inhibitor PemK [Caulobacter sp. Root1455]
MVTRGEVWLADLDPTVGHEIQKTRPCVIISPDELNKVVRTVLIAPMTTGGWTTSFRVPVVFQDRDGLIVPDQMRSIDRRRLRKKLGMLPEDDLQALLGVIRTIFEN